jgi:hypothetical protein
MRWRSRPSKHAQRAVDNDVRGPEVGTRTGLRVVG